MDHNAMANVAHADDDAALFAEVLALLDDSHEPQVRQDCHGLSYDGLDYDNAPVMSLPTTAAVAPRKPPRGIGSAARRKIAIDALRIEHQQLTELLEQLRRTSSTSHTLAPFQSARERAMAEQIKRRRAEQECAALRHALLQQMQFLKGLRGAITGGPSASLGLNLCHYLHNFTRLPRDRQTRQHEYMALSRAERLDAAVEMLCHETGAISVVDAHLQTDYIRESDESCAASTLSVFTMDGDDVGAVLRAACAASHDILFHARPFQNIGLHGEIVDADALAHNNVQYRATSVHKRSDDAEHLTIESLEVTMHRHVDDAAVMLWDFVDEDELEPLGGKRDISRQGLGACLIRREMCPDGVRRIVYREVSFRRDIYCGSATILPPSVQRYFAARQSSLGPNELVFRDLLGQQITLERSRPRQD